MSGKRGVRKGRNLTFDVCKEIAAKYPTVTSLWRKDQAVARKCKVMGWDAMFFPDMKSYKKTRELTYDYCKEVASHCKNAYELGKVDSSVRSKCYDNGWVYDFFPNTKHSERTLDFETCLKSAKRFNSRMEFNEGDGPAYSKSCRMGWIDSFGLYSPGSKKYNEDYIIELAKKFEYHRDFRINHPKLYAAACKRGILDKCPWLKKSYANKGKELIYSLYVYEFKRTHTAYVGITVDKISRHRDHLDNTDPVGRYANKVSMKVPTPKYLRDGISQKEAIQAEKDMIEEYRNNGWNMINTAPGGSVGSLGSDYWTKKRCIELAKTYKLVRDFQRDHRWVWEKMRKKGWDKDCTWLKRLAVPTGYWQNMSKADAHKIAKQFTSRNKFERAYRRLYVIAFKKGWVDEWFPPNNQCKKIRPVIAYELDGVTEIARFSNMISATRAFGGKRGNINNCCNGITKTAYGKIFRYAD